MSCCWRFLVPPASIMTIRSPSLPKYTLYPGPKSMRHSNTPAPKPLTFEKFPKASDGCGNFGGRLGFQGIKPVGIRTTPKPVVILSHVDHLYGTIYVTIVKAKEPPGSQRLCRRMSRQKTRVLSDLCCTRP